MCGARRPVGPDRTARQRGHRGTGQGVLRARPGGARAGRRGGRGTTHRSRAISDLPFTPLRFNSPFMTGCTMKAKSPQQRLDGFIDKYTPEIAAFARAVLDKLRSRLPGAIELVYDNYNWLVIGFGPTERPSDAVFSVVLPPGRVTFCFLQGAKLPDPHRLLRGSGKVVRNP